MTTNLYLIRHGEGAYQVDKIVPGPKGDKGLSPLGREQATRLRDRLAATNEFKADVLIASPLNRARETAEIIAPALKLSLTLDEEVQEMKPGEADGLTFAESEEKYGPYPDFRLNPFEIRCPDSENWPQFVVRAAHALNRITTEHEGKNIVVVCHGGIVDASLTYFFGLSGVSMPRVILNTHNTSITRWRKGVFEEHPQVWQLAHYNDTMHLRGIKTGRRVNWADLAGQPVTGQDQMAVPIPTEEPD